MCSGCVIGFFARLLYAINDTPHSSWLFLLYSFSCASHTSPSLYVYAHTFRMICTEYFVTFYGCYMPPFTGHTIGYSSLVFFSFLLLVFPAPVSSNRRHRFVFKAKSTDKKEEMRGWQGRVWETQRDDKHSLSPSLLSQTTN